MKSKDPSFDALLKLGAEFLELTRKGGPLAGGGEDPELELLLQQVHLENPWFTRDSCLHALEYWGEVLREPTLDNWLSAYEAPGGPPLQVALVMAGNIPLVGFHDLISVLLTGNSALVKSASTDTLLLKYVVSRLIELEPTLGTRISLTSGKLGDFDAVIATGSTNTSRYFEYYFSKKPHIIRKNRHGVAVLTGDETGTELEGLAEDIFRYFGMGCRSVSKLYVPETYDFDPFFKACYRFRHFIDHQKYGNNYDYNKAVYLMSGSAMLDNGFLLLKEDAGIGSPIGTLFYETYTDRAEVLKKLEAAREDLQCVVGGSRIPGAIPFGTAQRPGLSTYADGVDTVDFLLKTSADSPALS